MDPRERIGRPVETISTPALIVDAEALEHNLRTMAACFRARPAKLRPHIKSHKCATLARRQLAAGGAVGITCAKLSEAEALAGNGIEDILIANQVVGAEKAARLAALNRRAVVRCAVDCPANVADLGAAAVAAGVVVPVLIEVDIGMRRCGVPPGDEALALARTIARTPGLRLDGLQGYEGHLVMTPDPDERRRKVLAAFEPLLALRRALSDAGLPCPILSGGGTGTYDITGNIPGVDEIQAGSYALMDNHYRKVRPEFRNALSILATVISSSRDFLVADVGLKGMGNEFGLPALAEAPEARARYIAEEHTPFDGVSRPVGTKVRLIPSHGCTTCNLHRRLWIAREGRIEDVWPIEAAGCLE